MAEKHSETEVQTDDTETASECENEEQSIHLVSSENAFTETIPTSIPRSVQVKPETRHKGKEAMFARF